MGVKVVETFKNEVVKAVKAGRKNGLFMGKKFAVEVNRIGQLAVIVGGETFCIDGNDIL